MQQVLTIGGGTDCFNYRISATANNATTTCGYDDETVWVATTNTSYELPKLPDDFDLKLQMQREAVLEKTQLLRDYLRSGDPRRYFLRSCAVAAVANRENLKRCANQIRAPNHRDLQK